MKFTCPQLTDATKVRIDLQTGQRVAVVDQYLCETLRTFWKNRPKTVREHVTSLPRRALWEFALQSNAVIRRSAVNAAYPTVDFAIEASLLDVEDRQATYIIRSGNPVLEDINTAWHPQFHGRKARPSESPVDEASRQIQLALRFLDCYPELSELVASECGAICIINAFPALDRGEYISLTSKMVPGLVYASIAPTILLAESLVHECAHLRFRALEEIDEFYENSRTLSISTPLRPDPRPISGLMHQLVVLRYLASMFEQLVTSDNEVVNLQRRQVEKRFRGHLRDLDAGKIMAKNAASALTAHGRHFLERLLEESEPLWM